MAIRTTGMGGSSLWTHGWHLVTLKDAKYGVYNGDTKYIDANFEEYPDNTNLRVYEAKSKTGEEFAIAKLFRLANAGIIGEVQDTAGKKLLQFDDEASNLNGKQIHVFLYKNEDGFFQVLNRIAPVAQEGEVISFNDNDVSYWQLAAEKYYEEYKKPSESSDDMLSMDIEDIAKALDSDNGTEKVATETVESTDTPF